jgi:anti-sigma factor RsiW
VSTTRPVSEDDLHAYVDGALDAERRGEVEAYLAANPAVAERVRVMSAGRTALRDHFAPVLAEPVPSALNLQRMMAEHRRPAAARWRSAAVAVLLLGLGGVGGWFGRSATEPELTGVAALAQEAASNWSVYAADRIRPVEIRASQASDLSNWMKDRLGRDISPPELASSGYRLMGGRVVATPHGPAGLYMYDDDRGSRIVLLMRQMQAPDENAPMSRRQADKLTTWSWTRGGFGFSLAGSMPGDRLHSLANEVRRQADIGI